MGNNTMRIAAIGMAALEIEFACLATLSKFVREGHEVHIVVAREIGNRNSTDTARTENNLDWSDDEARSFFGKFGLTNIWFLDRKLDYAAVTQENATVINSHIKRINPDMVIMPFWKSINQTQRILSRTALIACRGVGSILMYELEQNSVFTPSISFVVSANEIASKVSPHTAFQNVKNRRGGQSTTTIFQTSVNIADGENGDKNIATESFESHRMLLAEHTWL
jgi:LmbE family N-acetylglucosaminyl deacetylase